MRKHLNTVSEEDDKEEEVALTVKEAASMKNARKKPVIEMRQLRLEIHPKNKELVFAWF